MAACATTPKREPLSRTPRLKRREEILHGFFAEIGFVKNNLSHARTTGFDRLLHARIKAALSETPYPPTARVRLVSRQISSPCAEFSTTRARASARFDSQTP
jgi:hypothetical protein